MSEDLEIIDVTEAERQHWPVFAGPSHRVLDIFGKYLLGVTTEVAWYTTPDGQVRGIVLEDRIHHEWNWIVLQSDATGTLRAMAIEVSHQTLAGACGAVQAAMRTTVRG
jgi:hypothetical protein